jgi:hypothetical protein
MKTIRETRHENFKVLFQMWKEHVWKQFPDQPDRGMLRLMSKTFEMSERFLSHLNCDAKPMGSRVARQLEAEMGLPTGWMDTDHGEQKTTSEQEFLAVMSMLYKSAPLEAMQLMTSQLTKRLDIDTVVARKLMGAKNEIDTGATPEGET